MDGHDVVFFLPPEVFGEVTLSKKSSFENEILEMLRQCAKSYEREYFSAVHFEDEDENDPEYQNAISLKVRPQLNPDLLPIWRQGHIRLFVSHRDEFKASANLLAAELEEYGISSFVAHDTIQPMTSWKGEIIKGLETMEIMLAFITDNFQDSVWTNQEIGFALGRNIPVVSLKLQSDDPTGFIGERQALKGKLEDVVSSIPELYKLLAENLGHQSRLQSGLITAFVSSRSYPETQQRFDRMKKVVKKLSDADLSVVVDGFRSNDQLHQCIYLTSKYERLKTFLELVTGNKCVINGKDIDFPGNELSIPF
ncbi:MAG: toll/interleukin-1 receptor domain-containing protein [Gammaproteobacteria bacterium]|nr:toll/interleukin-1 receptor domain-containing protein [Gammaproteobacteria bacterium]